MGKPKSGTVVFFNKNNEIWVNDLAVKRAYFNAFFKNVKINSDTIRFAFDANMSYGMYIQNKILMESLEKQSDSIEEFIY
jgi:biopolymer transport protein ExbD